MVLSTELTYFFLIGIVPPCLSNNHVWDVSHQTRRVIRARDEAVQSLGNYAITGDSVTQSRSPSGSFDNAVSNFKTIIQGLVDLGPILTGPLQDDQDTSSEKSLELNLTADYSAIVGSTSRRLSKLVYATPQQEQKASTDAPRNSSVVKLPVMEATVKHEDSKENEPISWDDPHNQLGWH
ncbi:hypothetical protein EDB80DRAFT_36716 [Ilyonectria destructans]|nr:hypothetical protein EDB80DRAFT_36716 [Ilyonectria destructans]